MLSSESRHFLANWGWFREPRHLHGNSQRRPIRRVSIVTGIVSALKGVPVRNDVALTGEITLTGKVLPVGGIQQKIRAAYEAGIREIILPQDNLEEAKSLPSYTLEQVKLVPVAFVSAALEEAMLPARTG